MEAEGDALTAAGLARLAGVGEAEIGRMVELGVLVPRDGPAPFLARDLHKLRLAMACERAGLPMDGIAAAIRAGRLSFAFMEAVPYAALGRPLGPDLPAGERRRPASPSTTCGPPWRRWASPGCRRTSRSARTSWRWSRWCGWPSPAGIFDPAWIARVGRAYAEGLRLAAQVETESYQARFEEPVLAAGLGQRRAMELASELAAEFLPLVDRALMGIYRRQQELVWTEHQVLNVEAALEEAGAIARPERVPAMCFLDLAGYTRLTEERGDQAAAELAGTLAVLVERSSRAHGGTPVKWLGDGVMLHFRDPAGAVEAALAMVGQVPEAGLPPAHVGVAAGPVVVQGGDYFGRTVNLASRVAARAQAGQVLVTAPVAQAPSPGGVTYTDLGELRLKGFTAPVRVLEARRA